MISGCTVLAGLGFLFLGVALVGLVLSPRSAVGESQVPSVEARVVEQPPMLEVVISVAAGHPRVRIESISVSRSVGVDLAAAAPAGFRLGRPPVPLMREAFEPDLDVLTDGGHAPSDAEMEGETDRQYQEHQERVLEVDHEFLS